MRIAIDCTYAHQAALQALLAQLDELRARDGSLELLLFEPPRRRPSRIACARAPLRTRVAQALARFAAQRAALAARLRDRATRSLDAVVRWSGARVARALRERRLGLLDGFALLAAPPVLLMAWAASALFLLSTALASGLAYPLAVLERRARIGSPRRQLAALSAVAAEAWVLAWPGPALPVAVPTLLLVAETDREQGRLEPLPSAATLVACSSAATRDALWQCGVSLARLRIVAPHDPAEWAALLRELGEAAEWPERVDEALARPWPVAVPSAIVREEPPEVFLFLQDFAIGGVLQAVKDLLHDLAEIAAERPRLRLSLGVLDTDDESTRQLLAFGDRFPLRRFRLNPLTVTQARALLGPALSPGSERSFVFFGGAVEAALRADAWFALTDRFALPLLPARPYAVMIYDMIQRRVPEVFDAVFLEHARRGMAPTARVARFVVTTSAATAADVREAYGLTPQQVRLVPVSHDPARRFGGLVPSRVEGARPPFVLNVANAALHKGALTLLRGFARFKRDRRDGVQLVICGYATDAFSLAHDGAFHPNAAAVHALLRELRLEEPQDVLFLGYVSDAQLADLYARCAVVVSAAKHDNGSFSVCEATFFGKPAVTSSYLASEYICERFRVPARRFPVDDERALADALRASVDGPLPQELADLDRARARFADPELSHRRYAERIYELLVELGESARGRVDSPTA